MAPPTSDARLGDRADDLDHLRTVLLRLAHGGGVGEDLAFDDDLRAALHTIAARVARPESARAPAPARLAAPAAGSAYLVLARLDGLAKLTSRIGPEASRVILTALRDRILRRLPSARIGRTGHGVVEFTFHADDLAGAEAEMHRLHAQLERTFEVEGERFAFPAVMGAAAVMVGAPFSRTVELAERALVKAESEGGKCAFFCERERSDGSERLALMRDLRAAIAEGELTVVHQPKLNLRTGAVDAVEALVRWSHPERGLVAPDQFIGLAEDTGDIGALTRHVLLTALADQVRLAQAGFVVAMHVNLSGRLVADEAFCAWVLEVCGGSAGRLGLEITETAVIADPDRALKHLRAFADAGVAVAIDDYGSGLSSLAYLKALPARELKIDKTFVLGLSSSHRDPLIVRSTIDLAHALEMEVTAEGVDDPVAMALLRVMGCDRVQGFHVSPPLTLGALTDFLRDAEGRDLASAPAMLMQTRRRA